MKVKKLIEELSMYDGDAQAHAFVYLDKISKTRLDVAVRYVVPGNRDVAGLVVMVSSERLERSGGSVSEGDPYASAPTCPVCNAGPGEGCQQGTKAEQVVHSDRIRLAYENRYHAGRAIC